MKKNKKIAQTNVPGGGNFSCRHPKLWEYIKSNIKAFFITGAITFVVTVSATTYLNSQNIKYRRGNQDKSLKAAVDELYQKAAECGKILVDNDGKKYEKIEYLESSGTQYIDTDYTPKINTKVELELKFSGNFKGLVPSGGTSCSSIFGAIDTVNNSLFSVNFGSSQYWQFYPWVDKIYGSGGVAYPFNITEDLKQNRNTIMMKSGLITYGTLSKTIATKTTNTPMNLVLFGSNKGNSICIFNNYYMYVYSFKIYEGDTLKKDYTPALDKNNRPCLFDKVGRECYYNQGTGEFLHG